MDAHGGSACTEYEHTVMDADSRPNYQSGPSSCNAWIGPFPPISLPTSMLRYRPANRAAKRGKFDMLREMLARRC